MSGAAASPDISIRVAGRAGRITLTRPKALNAVTWDMCLAIEAALDAWRDDPEVALVVIDAEGERAFSAGGDLAAFHEKGRDASYGRAFWADEYRLDAKIADYPKPYVAFMQGFTMGGGVGISCHGSHRVVGDTSRIAMPECAIGLIPDVGGTYLLSRAPGHAGEYLAVTGTRMGPGDAIHAGFADIHVAEAEWPGLIAALEETGDPGVLERAAHPRPLSPLADLQRFVDDHFQGASMTETMRALAADGAATARATEERIRGGSPLAVACAFAAVRRARDLATVREALAHEYRFTARAVAEGEFLEGIRAAIVDKDRAPRWRHARVEDVSEAEVAAMLAPLPDAELDLGGPA